MKSLLKFLTAAGLLGGGFLAGVYAPADLQTKLKKELAARIAALPKPPASAPAETSVAAAPPAETDPDAEAETPPPYRDLLLTPKNKNGPYAVQLGVFSDPQATQGLQAQLREQGQTPKLVAVSVDQQTPWHVLTVGEFSALAEAERLASRLTRELRLNAKAIHLPPTTDK